MNADRTQISEPLQHFIASEQNLAGLNDLDNLVKEYQAKRSASQIPLNTVEALRIELTYHSNAIEGNTLSLRETQLVVEGKSPAGEKNLREIYEARNHDRALRLIESWVEKGQPEPLTERHLLDVHGAVMVDIDDRAAGRFRSNRVLISGTGYVPPGSHRFDVLIPALLAIANQKQVHPVLQAAELHYNLVAVHPFDDGNGRTARLLMNYHLLKSNYPLAIIEIGRRGDYLAALDEANHGRLEPFTALVIQSVLASARKILG